MQPSEITITNVDFLGWFVSQQLRAIETLLVLVEHGARDGSLVMASELIEDLDEHYNSTPGLRSTLRQLRRNLAVASATPPLPRPNPWREHLLGAAGTTAPCPLLSLPERVLDEIRSWAFGYRLQTGKLQIPLDEGQG